MHMLRGLLAFVHVRNPVRTAKCRYSRQHRVDMQGRVLLLHCYLFDERLACVAVLTFPAALACNKGRHVVGRQAVYTLWSAKGTHLFYEEAPDMSYKEWLSASFQFSLLQMVEIVRRGLVQLRPWMQDVELVWLETQTVDDSHYECMLVLLLAIVQHAASLPAASSKTAYQGTCTGSRTRRVAQAPPVFILYFLARRFCQSVLAWEDPRTLGADLRVLQSDGGGAPP